jgi:hypothetical protein
MSDFSYFHDFVRTWVASALAYAFPTGAPPVIRAYQNAAKPAGVYIAVETDARAERFGRPFSRVLAASDGSPVATVQTEFQRSPVIWEIGAHGEYLEAVVATLELESFRAASRKAGISILSVGDILTMPYSAPGAEITREHRLQLEISTTTQLIDSDATYIETVDTPTGTYTE